jgi:hypothetical protein
VAFGDDERIRHGLALASMPSEARTAGEGATGECRAPDTISGTAYLEIVDAVDQSVAFGTPFGSAAAARSDAGGGWVDWVVVDWVVAVPDIDSRASRVGRPAIPGTRRRRDGMELRWRIPGHEIVGTGLDLPFLVARDIPAELHPSAGAAADRPRLTGVGLIGDSARLAAWLGGPFPGVTPEVLPATPGRRPGLQAPVHPGARGAGVGYRRRRCGVSLRSRHSRPRRRLGERPRRPAGLHW